MRSDAPSANQPDPSGASRDALTSRDLTVSCPTARLGARRSTSRSHRFPLPVPASESALSDRCAVLPERSFAASATSRSRCSTHLLHSRSRYTIHTPVHSPVDSSEGIAMVGQAPPAPWPDLAAGPATPASLCALVSVDAGVLTGAQLVDAVVCAEKAVSLLLGVQARLQSALAVPFVAGDPMRLAAKLARRSGLADGVDDERDEQFVQAMVPEAAQSLAAGEIAAALRIAPVTAGIRVRDAVGLAEEFTPARQALEDGILDRGKLRAIVDQVQVLPAEQIGPVLEQVLPEVVDRCTSEVREIAAQAVITADPDGAADRHRQAADRRELTLTPGSDAMATLKAFLPADGAVKIFQVSDLLATGTAGLPGDGRGIGARRVDALVDLADRLLSDGHIDLTGFIGQPLPDPTSPTHRPRRASHSTTTRTGRGAGGLIDPAGTGGATTRRRASDHDDPADHDNPNGHSTTTDPTTTNPTTTNPITTNPATTASP